MLTSINSHITLFIRSCLNSISFLPKSHVAMFMPEPMVVEKAARPFQHAGVARAGGGCDGVWWNLYVISKII